MGLDPLGRDGVEPQAIILNGGSSSGKSTLAMALQEVLPDYWLRLGVDTLIAAAPGKLLAGEGLEIGADGSVGVGQDFTRVEGHWMTGIAAMIRSGAHVIIEDNFVSGPPAQQRWQAALTGISVAWIGVTCAPAIAERREGARLDRQVGMAARQASSVHEGIVYDMTIDTGLGVPMTLANRYSAISGANSAHIRAWFCPA